MGSGQISVKDKYRYTCHRCQSARGKFEEGQARYISIDRVVLTFQIHIVVTRSLLFISRKLIFFPGV